MRAMSLCAWTLALWFVAIAGTAANDCKDVGAGGLRPESVPGRLVVKPRDEVRFQRLLKEGLGQIEEEKLTVRKIGTTGYYTIDSRSRKTEEMFSPFFRQSGSFETIQADPAVVGLKVPLEAEFRDGNMWGLEAIHAQEAWDFGTGSSAVVAAVVDSGIDRKHADLQRNTWNIQTPFVLTGTNFIANCAQNDFGFDAIDGSCTPVVRSPHGTVVSGIIGADGKNEGKFVVGVNWSVTLLPVTLLDENSIGCASRAVEALEFVRLVKKKGIAPVRVVNLSWGMLGPSEAVKEQLDVLAFEDVVIVAAAGNQGCTTRKTLYPAAYKSVSTLISVGATNKAGGTSLISNCDNTAIDIGAPGEEIRTTFPHNVVDFAAGTSVAAAFVTGAVALMASQCPELNALALKNLILDSASRRRNLAADFIDGRFLDLKAAAVACRALH
jgi:subtilisin family serine protease